MATTRKMKMRSMNARTTGRSSYQKQPVALQELQNFELRLLILLAQRGGPPVALPILIAGQEQLPVACVR